ncbi:T9SS type A sorting domain-containing protein [Lacinutrix sp. C3R15]|uniref:T9SS type A sorting domain-containing protein n=1 Tax=Flavobacteriaceae TaxID=49546 RepID=UPI001C082EC7|nr:MULTISPECIES: T9SS type A sorting domain-containing protein [Flavobacteriaceae]MBU2940376.1 T9SS type A sorting domain-containing protein [Lacinutrix sp. C3R15]MDO6623696.1 T9SS type A sorting domain-containing protein [Oceanihabitans sp. 1_MG-2023]
MKKTITLLLMVFTIVSYSQSIDYKAATKIKGSNYYEITNKVREELGEYNKNATKAEIKKHKQFERWAYYWKDRVDINGNFPNAFSGWYNAGIIDANGKLNTTTNTTNRVSGTQETWTNIGPQEVPDANGYPNNPQLGRLTNFLRYKHATDASQNVLFVSAPVGGVWKSLDNGETWSPKLDFLAGIGVTDIKSSSSDINNPGTIYISTGDFDAKHINSIGVYKSTDFGETYQPTSLTFSLDEKETTSNLIVIDANTVVVGTNKYIKKTTDGGLTWSNVYTHNYDDAVLGKFHRNGTNIMCSGSWGGLFFSSNNGNTWSVLISEGENSARHAITTDENGVFYVQAESGQVSSYNPSATSPVLTAVGSPTVGYNTQDSYNQCLAVKNGLIVSGGVDGINSDDLGNTWYITLNNAWQDNSSDGSYGHADIHEIGYLDNGFSFWNVNDGGLNFVTYSNIAEEKPTVEYKSNGVIVTQLYSVAITPQTSTDNIIMGNQDNDGYSLEMVGGSPTWVTAGAGDGTCTAVDYSNPQIRYLGSQNGGLTRADNGFLGDVWGTNLTTPTTGAPFVWTLKMHSTTSTTLYGGFADVYKSTNKGDTWSNLNSGAGQIEFIETFGDNLFVIGENAIKKSTNDGSSWSSVTEPEAGAKMNSISLDQNNTNTVYATVNGYVDGSKVFKSTNGGTTWTNISTGLPNVVAKQVVLKQNQGQEILFLGTEIGVYYKIGTDSWTKLGQGLPNVVVSDIEINYTQDKLVVGTFGRGLWEISIANNTLGVNEVEADELTAPTIYPNPVEDGVLNIKLNDTNSNYDYKMYNVIGGLVKKGTLNTGLNTLDVSNVATGVYVVRMTDGKTVSSQKVIIK